MADARSSYPPLDKVGARFLTPSGWVVGTLHVPPGQPLLEFLNDTEGFYRLTNVSLPGQPETLEFMALQRSAVLMVVPGSERNVIGQPWTEPVSHEVTCVFSGGLVMGVLSLPTGLRVSDELMQSPDFFVLQNCTLALDASPDPIMEAESMVVVQATQMFGVAETSP